MNNATLDCRRSERGFSLAEVLVASAIFIVIMVAALLLYDRGNKVFQQGNDATDMQQNVRVAYDRMLSDVRMAGFDYLRAGRITTTQQIPTWAPLRGYTAGTLVTPVTPNGHVYRATTDGTSGTSQPSWNTGAGVTTTDGATLVWQENGGVIAQQPDEQIEYAGATAITIRGNFDYSANVAGDGDHGRETTLETSNFPIVTTGNDEIVTYALVSGDTTKNSGTISFYADVNNGACSPTSTPCRRSFPGGVAERLLSITGVDLTNNNPPYTLYRFTIDSTGAIVRTPLANNIRSLNFIYFSDTAGTTLLRDTSGALAPNVGGAGQYDPAAPNAVIQDRLTRARIRSLRVRLVGMTGVSDPNFNDTDTIAGVIDTSATTGTFPMLTDSVGKNYRKMALDTMVVPRNLGLAGIAQSYYDPPVAPSVTSVCTGYCGIAVVSWTPNTNTPNANYAVLWDTSPTGDFTNAVDAGTANSWALDLTQQNLAATYYFKVRAYNDAGSAVSANYMSGPIANGTQPGPVLSATATNGTSAVAGKVHLTWSVPITNANGNSNLTCTGSGTVSAVTYVREIRGFRVYRGTSATFTTTSGATLVADENSSGAAAPSGDSYGNYTFDDTSVSSCSTYYYRIQAVEWCEPSTTYNKTANRSTSIGVETPLNSGASSLMGTTPDTTPATPTNLVLSPSSTCDNTTNACNISMSWSKVTTDTTGATLTIANYQVERQTYLSTTPTVLVGTATATVGAGAVSTVSYTDTMTPLAIDHTATAVKYIYKYRVKAIQPGTCSPSLWSAQITYPAPCSFSGAVIVQTGASSGDGLTPASAWVMASGDGLSVQPPAGGPFAKVVLDITSSSGTAIASFTSTSNPANFSWSDQASDTYTLTFTMTNSTGCVQQLTRYVTQEATTDCSLTIGSSSVLSKPATYQLALQLINAAGEALSIQAVDFTWTQPSKIVWNTVGFPSGKTIDVSTLSTSPSFTITPVVTAGGLTASDVLVPANGQLQLLLNMAKTNGSPSISTGIITNICVKYTRPSVPGKTFYCRIVPTKGAGNPFTSCN